MLQTVYRNLVCKQWDLAYVTQLVQLCDCGPVPVCSVMGPAWSSSSDCGPCVLQTSVQEPGV